MKRSMLLTALFLTFGAGAQLDALAQASEQNEQTIRRLFAGYNDPNQDRAELLDEVIADSFAYGDANADHIWRDKAAWADVLNQLQERIGDQEMRLADVLVLDDRGVAEWVWTGMHKATGDTFTIRGASVFEFRDGKIVQGRDYWDTSKWPAPNEGQHEADAGAADTTEEAAVRRVGEAVLAAFNARDAAAMARHLHPDVTSFGDDGFQGGFDVQELQAGFDTGAGGDLETEYEDVSVVGDMASSAGYFTGTRTDEQGNTRTVREKVSVTYVKHDGAWKVLHWHISPAEPRP